MKDIEWDSKSNPPRSQFPDSFFFHAEQTQHAGGGWKEEKNRMTAGVLFLYCQKECLWSRHQLHGGSSAAFALFTRSVVTDREWLPTHTRQIGALKPPRLPADGDLDDWAYSVLPAIIWSLVP